MRDRSVDPRLSVLYMDLLNDLNWRKMQMDSDFEYIYNEHYERIGTMTNI